MRRRFTDLCALALVVGIFFPPDAQAQTVAAASQTARPFTYGASREVTLTGKVLSVLAKPAPGMIMGSHLLLETPDGLVDASLGRFGLRGAGAVSVAAGQRVEVTGVMKIMKDKQVVLVRTVKVGSEIYTVRNEHGFPVSPQSRERAKSLGGTL